MDVVKKMVIYTVSKLGEVDVKRLTYIMYLVDRELYYLCGFTLFEWRLSLSGLRSFDIYNTVDELEAAGYLEREVRDDAIVYRARRSVEPPKQIRDVVYKVVEKVKGVDYVFNYILKFIDPNVVEIAGLKT